MPFSNNKDAAQNVTILTFAGYTYKASCSLNANDVVTVALFVIPPSGTYSWFSFVNKEVNDDDGTWTTVRAVYTSLSGTLAIETEAIGSPSTLVRSFTSATVRGSAGALAHIEYMMTAHRSTDACQIEGAVIPLS